MFDNLSKYIAIFLNNTENTLFCYDITFGFLCILAYTGLHIIGG
jgi:hypothetical protein